MRLSGTKTNSIHQYRGLGNQLWDLGGARPTLDLRFADNKSLVDATTGQNLVTFTRASSGTYVGSDGLIKTATTNLLLRSEEFDNASWTKNNSSVTANQIEAPNGTLTADKLVENTANNNHFLEQPLTVADSVSVTGSCYLKKAERSYARIRINNKTGGGGRVWFDLTSGTQTAIDVGYTATITPVGNDWYRCTLTEPNIGSGGSAVSLQVFTQSTSGSQITYTGDGTSGIYIWGAQLEQSSSVGEYIPTTSTINSAPRFNHDPTTGESLGLLVEEQRTNLLEYSEDISSWSQITGGSPTITPNAATAPDGTNTATLIENTAAASFLGDSTSYTSGTTYTFSGYFKANDGDQVTILLYSAGAASGFWNSETSNVAATFDLTNGTFTTFPGGVAPTTSSITDVGNGWWRCSITATATANNSGSNQLIRNVNGETEGIYAWGYQIEAGAFPTSYIPTTTATVTRSADVASITGTNFSSWYRQDEGTVFADVNSAPVSNIPQVAFDIAEGVGNERIFMRRTSSAFVGFAIVDNSVAQVDVGSVNTIAANSRYIAAGAYKLNSAHIGVNGQLGSAEDSIATIPTVDRLFIGQNSGSGQAVNGTIRRLTFWPQRLSNSTLQAITQ